MASASATIPVHRTKTNEGRRIKLGAGLLAIIEEYRRFPLDWVIPDERVSQNPSDLPDAGASAQHGD